MNNNSPITFEDLIGRLSSNNQIKNDDGLRDRDINSLTQHINDYDDILRNYAIHVDKTLKHKRRMKITFFAISIITMLACISIIVVFIAHLLKNSCDENFDALNYIAPAITSITSFLTVYIIIPKIIAKYLFNSKEDESMKAIISSIQKYDKYIRDSLSNKRSE